MKGDSYVKDSGFAYKNVIIFFARFADSRAPLVLEPPKRGEFLITRKTTERILIRMRIIIKAPC